eukprot:m.307610 g.307610  ORF g.307610 m.307610 type:complete len:108 (+) comp42530_c0_seq1:623-946(+)
MSSPCDPWRLNNSHLLDEITTLAWAMDDTPPGASGSGRELKKLYSTGRIAYEFYSRLKDGGEQRNSVLRAAYAKKITEYVDSHKHLSKEKLAVEVQKMIRDFAGQIE